MFLVNYVLHNYVMLAELFGLWIITHVSVHVSKKSAIFTRLSLALLLLDSVLYNLELWTQDFPTVTPLRWILTATIYFIQPVILLMTMQLTVPMKKNLLVLFIPIIVTFPVYYTSQWTRLVFSFTGDNHYEGGPLCWMPYIVFAAYLALTIVRCFIHFKKSPLRDKMNFVYVVLASAFGVLMYIVLDYTSDYSAIFTSAILLYYLLMYIHMAKTDPLTGLMNRQCCFRDMDIYAQKITAIASVDMNELKWLNDTKGHSEGDKALVTIAECLCDSSRKRVYRVGGDEFTVLYCGATEDEVKADISAMRERVSQTPYVCAFGYATVNDGRLVKDAMFMADKAMYADKSAIKKRILEEGGTLHRRYDDVL